MDTKVINVFSGGYDICATSYSAEKRHAKVSTNDKEERPHKNTSITSEKEINFDETDGMDV